MNPERFRTMVSLVLAVGVAISAALIGAGFLAIALFLGLPMLAGQQNSGPLSSVTPSALVTPSESPAASPRPDFASPPEYPDASPSFATPSPPPSPSSSLANAAGSLS